MRLGISTFALAALLVCAGFAAAGDEIGEVTPDQLESMLNAGTAVAVDANGAKVRSEHGSVPDALLLSDYRKYDPAKELPAAKDQQLVFYCANEMCGAAPAAAGKARAAGYENVAVMPAGIMGWAQAGKPVRKPGQSG